MDKLPMQSGSMEAMMHRVKPKIKADVAQSVEQLPRKQEVEGSNPSVSSNNEGFSNSQRNKMATIVHHRVKMEEQTTDMKAIAKDIELLKSDYRGRIDSLESRLRKGQEQYVYHERLMTQAEQDLRGEILSDLPRIGLPIVTESEQVQEEELIGRAD